jgi:site-specific DNA-methyltransferase (adenine-specific)
MRDEPKLINSDCSDVLKGIESESIDCILTDPPYQYLKSQKLDVPFDEEVFFAQAKRVLKKDGFVVLFGRGTPFYRWNVRLADLGFTFKEEIVWDKSQSSSPLMAISRVHETVSIYTKGNGLINKVKVPYLKMKGHDLSSVIQDVKRLRSVLNNTKSLNAVQEFLEGNAVNYEPMTRKHSVQVEEHIRDFDRSLKVMRSVKNGMSEKSIIRTDRIDDEKFTKFGISSPAKTGDRSVNVAQSIEFGLTEKSIIKEIRPHYTAIHPTQKPVRLLERLLALVTKKGDVVLDPFAGSFSTGIACLNTSRHCIGIEIDNEYFEIAKKRIADVKAKEPLFMATT